MSGSGAAVVMLTILSTMEDFYQQFTIRNGGNPGKAERVKAFLDMHQYDNIRSTVDLIVSAEEEFTKFAGSQFGELPHADRISLVAFVKRHFTEEFGDRPSSSSRSATSSASGSARATNSSESTSTVGKKSSMKTMNDLDDKECSAPSMDTLVKNIKVFTAMRRLGGPERIDLLQGPHFDGTWAQYHGKLMQYAMKMGSSAQLVPAPFTTSALWEVVQEFPVFQDPSKTQRFLECRFSFKDMYLLQATDFLPRALQTPRAPKFFGDATQNTVSGKTILVACLEGLLLAFRFVFDDLWSGAFASLLSELRSMTGVTRYLPDVYVYCQAHNILASFSELVNETKGTSEAPLCGPTVMVTRLNAMCAALQWPVANSTEIVSWTTTTLPHLQLVSPAASSSSSSGGGAKQQTTDNAAPGKDNKSNNKRGGNNQSTGGNTGGGGALSKRAKGGTSSSNLKSSSSSADVKAEKGAAESAETKEITKARDAPCGFALAELMEIKHPRTNDAVSCHSGEKNCSFRHVKELSGLTVEEATAAFSRFSASKSGWLDAARAKISELQQAKPYPFKSSE